MNFVHFISFLIHLVLKYFSFYKIGLQEENDIYISHSFIKREDSYKLSF